MPSRHRLPSSPRAFLSINWSAGYVERVPDPSDARSRLVRITERGRQTLPLAATVVSDVETEWTEHLGKRRMGQLREILARLREITDPYASSAR